MSATAMRGEYVMVGGKQVVRVYGVAAVGTQVRITAGDMVELHTVRAVEWSGTAKDGRVASMVTTGGWTSQSLAPRARRAVYGHPQDRACTGRDSCRCFSCVS